MIMLVVEVLTSGADAVVLSSRSTTDANFGEGWRCRGETFHQGASDNSCPTWMYVSKMFGYGLGP